MEGAAELEEAAGGAYDEFVVFCRRGFNSSMEGARGSNLRLAVRVARKSDQASD